MRHGENTGRETVGGKGPGSPSLKGQEERKLTVHRAGQEQERARPHKLREAAGGGQEEEVAMAPEGRVSLPPAVPLRGGGCKQCAGARGERK